MGKILKKFKFFDYIIIFSLFILGIFIFIGLFRKSSFVEIVLKTSKNEWFIRQLKEGMEEKNIFGQTMAQIQSIKSYPVFNILNEKNKFYKDYYNKNLYIKIKLKAVYSPGENSYTYKGKKIMVGSYVELYINNFLIDGIITQINNNKNQKNIYQIKAQGKLSDINPAFPNTEGVPEYIADSIKEKTTMKDSLKNPAVRIDKKITEEAKMVTVDSFGQTHLSINPLRKDVYFDLTIWAEKIGDYYYLFGDENFPIIIGNQIPFTTDNNWLFITITNIKKIEKLKNK